MPEQEIKDIVFKSKQKLLLTAEANKIVEAGDFTNMLSDYSDKQLWKGMFFESKLNIVEDFAKEDLQISDRVIGSRDFKKFTDGWEIEKKKFLMDEYDKALQRAKEKRIKDYAIDQEQLSKDKWNIVKGLIETVKKAEDPNTKEFYTVKVADRKIVLDMIKTELGEPLKVIESKMGDGRAMTDDMVTAKLAELSAENPEAFEALAEMFDEKQTNS